MGLIPVGKRVLVREAEAKETTESGLFLPVNAQQEMITQGEVLCVPEVVEKDVEIPVDKGDKILYNRNVAVPVKDLTGEQLFTVDFERILVKFRD